MKFHALKGARLALPAALLIMAICLPQAARADAALAAAIPSDKAKQGIAFGASYNNATAQEAEERALADCRKQQGPTSLCRIVAHFDNRCVAIAADQQAGTPGWGWAIADTAAAASDQALAQCRSRSPANRAAYCVAQSACDHPEASWCRAEIGGAHAVSPELKIRGCTSVIEAAGLKPRAVSYALVQRSIAYFAKKQKTQGFADLRRAVKADPSYAWAWAESCSYDMWTGKDGKRAMQECSKAIAADPKDSSGWTYRGDIYLYNHDYKRAIADYDHALSLSPRWMWPWDNRGEAYLRLGNIEHAIADFDQVIKVSPDYAMGYLDRGIARLKQRQFAMSRADFDAGLKVDPKCASCLLGRGLVEQATGDHAHGDADIAAAKAMSAEAGHNFVEDGIKVP